MIAYLAEYLAYSIEGFDELPAEQIVLVTASLYFILAKAASITQGTNNSVWGFFSGKSSEPEGSVACPDKQEPKPA